jgi:hypothetical protein
MGKKRDPYGVTPAYLAWKRKGDPVLSVDPAPCSHETIACVQSRGSPRQTGQ